jgi:hypothetical protein
MNKMNWNGSTCDGSYVYLVIDRKAVVGPKRILHIQYEENAVVITVERPEKALMLLPNVDVDVIIHDMGGEERAFLEQITGLAARFKPNIRVLDARVHFNQPGGWREGISYLNAKLSCGPTARQRCEE